MSKTTSNRMQETARKLRNKGLSYGSISAHLGVAKSTLHYWLSDIPHKLTDPQVRLQHLALARQLAVRAIKAKRLKRLSDITDIVEKEVRGKTLDHFAQKTMLALLYWAEGNKRERAQFSFANTDPAFAALFLALLRNTFPIDERKIKIYLHLHHYHNAHKTRALWAKALNVPVGQFAKIYLKRRKGTKRKRKNFAGFCFIRYGKGAEAIRQELLLFGKAIQKMIVSPSTHPSFNGQDMRLRSA